MVKPGGKVVKKNYITAGGAQIAIVAEETKTIAGVVMDLLDTKYLHRDAVNSVDMITNQSGMVESYQHYKPFGERGGQIKVLAAGFMSSTPNSLSDLLGLHKLVAKGFGGHEELPDVGLIHMNGRVYDAKLGRFASADPHIQAAGNSQSYNRYTYVLNNPLKYTDPSGFFFKWILNKIKRGLSSLSPNMLTILSIAAMVLMGPGGAWAISSFSPIANAALAGAVSGFIGSGGSLKAAVVGGITGAAFGALHGVKADTLMSSQGMKKVFLHGLTGGASSVVNGGKFGPRFMSAGFTQAVTLGGGFQALGLKEGAQGWDGRAQNAIAAGIVGGTASVIGGGKFANGAMTGAMSRMFNDLAHDETAKQTNDHQKQAKNSLNADASKGNPTVTGSVEAGGQVFGGVIGASVSTGLTGDTLNPNACTVTTSCVQFGLGVFAGAGGSMGGGVSSEALRSGTTESFGIFGNIGAFGAAAGGSLNFGGGSAGGAKGFLGVGKGISGGVQFCQSSLSCLRN